ncbi:MAG: NCS2 family permease, partial [Bacilli bacterium]
LFIAFVGLKSAGIIVANEATLVALGDIKQPNVLLAIGGMILTLILMGANKKGAIFIGMIVTIIVGIIVGLIAMPQTIISSIPSVSPIAFKLFNVDMIKLLTSINFWFVVFSVLFLDFFDTAGTLMGVATRANLLDKQGNLIDANKALMADASATTLGAMIGTSSITSYGESIVGIESGGRTGLTSLTTAFCFILALFFSPLLNVVTSAITAPALITVGALMMTSIKKIDFDDFADAVAAFFTMIFMLLTYSIAQGIAVGFIMYVILKLAALKHKEIHPIMYGLAVLFIFYFIFR